MRYPDRGRAAILSVLAALATVPTTLWARPTDDLSDIRNRLSYVTSLLQDAQNRVVRDHSTALAADGAALNFEYTDGGALTLALDHGTVVVGGHSVGRYPSGGALQLGWRQLVLDASRTDTPAALALLRGWHPNGLSRDEEAYLELMQEKVSALSAPPRAAEPIQDVEPAQSGGLVIDLSDLGDPRLAPLLRSARGLRGDALRITVPGGRVHAGDFSVGTGQHLAGPLLVLRGNAEIYGTVDGNLASVEGNVVVHPGSVVTGDVLTMAGEVKDLGGEIRGKIHTLDNTRPPTRPADEVAPLSPMLRLARNAAGVAGVFLTLLLVGMGLVVFARSPLEVVSDTVLHSFSRSFLVGLLGQVLILPTFGMLVVGLVLTVAGILLVPFAVIVFALLLVLAVLGGFLAIAHAMGESITRRQLARGASIHSANSYRYVTVGLAAVAALWLAWLAFGWVPVAGTLVFATAILVTWMLATVGFGAALLSRAGLKEHFAGRLIPTESLTDEFLWATPQFGVTAVKRPGPGRTPPPLS